MNYSPIENGNGKVVAVVFHDPNSGRVVYKGTPNSELHRAFSIAVDRPKVINVASENMVVRQKISPTDDVYLRVLLDDFVHVPYKARNIESDLVNDRIDSYAERVSQQYLD